MNFESTHRQFPNVKFMMNVFQIPSAVISALNSRIETYFFTFFCNEIQFQKTFFEQITFF